MMLYVLCVFFFFSSRRRHTRSLCDWSSDVCSSDLRTPQAPYRPCSAGGRRRGGCAPWQPEAVFAAVRAPSPTAAARGARWRVRNRSEERRVGKECRSRGSPKQEKKKRQRGVKHSTT